jgi:hypothetical protein
MFSRQEASQLRKEFWTALGQYLKPIPSADGEKVNWLNYRTGQKGVQFKMDADNKAAVIAIEITHSDIEIQQLYFEQFEQMRSLFESVVGEKWEWKLHETDENGKRVSHISARLKDVNIFNKADWPALISFFKPRILALDEFWSAARYGFESLH